MGVKSTDSNSPYYDIYGPTAPGGSDAPLAFIPPPEPFSATGGTTYEPGNGYKYHKFTSSGSLVASGDPQPGCEILVVAGGGGGGSYYGGGGGGGGCVLATGTLDGGQTYPIGIGVGADGGSPGSQASDGNDSFFDGATPGPDFNLIAKGGGGGGGTYYGAQGSGRSGGCGGGSGGGDPSPANGQATQPGTHSPTPQFTITDYGQPGGFSVPSGGYATAGGGGASAAGGSSPGNVSGGGNGGTGQPFSGFEYPLIGMSPLNPKSPTNNHYAGGGGGRVYSGSGPAGSGAAGVGGGGQGFGSGAPAAIHASDGLGGGGGGTHPGGGGDGGDGIVVVRYPTS